MDQNSGRESVEHRTKRDLKLLELARKYNLYPLPPIPAEPLPEEVKRERAARAEEETAKC